MAIIINIDVMLAKRKMSASELADKVGITMARQIVQESFLLPRFCDSPGTGRIVYATSENRKNASLTPDRFFFNITYPQSKTALCSE